MRPWPTMKKQCDTSGGRSSVHEKKDLNKIQIFSLCCVLLSRLELRIFKFFSSSDLFLLCGRLPSRHITMYLSSQTDTTNLPSNLFIISDLEPPTFYITTMRMKSPSRLLIGRTAIVQNWRIASNPGAVRRSMPCNAYPGRLGMVHHGPLSLLFVRLICASYFLL